MHIVSSQLDKVSGGTALVEINTSGLSNWVAVLNDRDITASFHRSERTQKSLAILSGLKMGKNGLELLVDGATKSKLEILNHPLSGPIFSGPHQHPFLCQTEANGLGPALDADCAAKTVVRYYYKSTEPPAPVLARFARHNKFANQLPDHLTLGFKPYDPALPRPPDLAQTRMADGTTVEYIVRREMGVINRAVYDIRFLHKPGTPLPTPWNHLTRGWNGRLIYVFEGGCGASYSQGVLPNYFLEAYEPVVAQGYAVASSSLNILANNCNEHLSAETASMVREYFIKHYGEPVHTIGSGGSSGSVAAQLMAQDYPGILDGIIVYHSAPDHLSGLPVFSDCALIDHAVKRSMRSWTEAQRSAISGLATWQTCASIVSVLSWADWFDPKKCAASVPSNRIYDPITNPKGVRCTFYDNQINILGRDPKTGFARRTLDNVGIQYGLVAFNTGEIDAEQFIELNELIGGYDADGSLVATRTVADDEGLRIAYERGAVLTGRNLSDIPIIDWNQYLDDLANLHTRNRPLMTRARLIAANGDAGNQVILVTPRPTYDELALLDTRSIPDVGLPALVPAMDRWLTAIAADEQPIPLLAKIVRNKPAELADGCISTGGKRIVDAAFDDLDGTCNRLYPIHGNPRVAAGAPTAGDILKCQLKPVDPDDYSHQLTPVQLKRLKGIFLGGVCDYRKPGVGQPVKSPGRYTFAQ